MFDTIKIMLDTMIHLSQCFHCYGHWDYDVAIVKILRYGNLLTNTEIKDKLVKQDKKLQNRSSFRKLIDELEKSIDTESWRVYYIEKLKEICLTRKVD